MTPRQLQELLELRELPSDPADDAGDWVMLDDVLDGSHQLNISHEGGELAALEDMSQEWEIS